MRAFVAEQSDDGVMRGVREDVEIGDLGEGDVLVRGRVVEHELQGRAGDDRRGQVARISPLIAGIDLAGTFDEDSGEEVLAHGYDLGVSQHGGFAEFARVPSDWVVPLPDGLTAPSRRWRSAPPATPRRAA